jgi:ADP-heptose:LPS heptosyltransferase
MAIVKLIIQLILMVFFLPINYYKKHSFFVEKINAIVISASHLGIGNTIFLIPLIQTVKNSFPDKKLFCIANSHATIDILKRISTIDKVVEINISKGNELFKGIIGYSKTVRQLKADLYISHFLQNMVDFSVWGFFSRAKYRITYNTRINGCLDTFFLKYENSNHEVERNLKCADILNIRNEQLIHDINGIHLQEDEINFAKQFLFTDITAKEPILGIHPGCDRRNQHKRWSIENYIQVAKYYANKKNYQIIVFIGPGESDLLQDLRTIESNQIKIATDISLGKVMALIANCDLFLSNDSGLMHIAAAFKIPIVTLFGTTSPLKNHPWKTDHILIQKADRQEFYKTDFIEDYKNIGKIKPEEVIEAIDSLQKNI